MLRSLRVPSALALLAAVGVAGSIVLACGGTDVPDHAVSDADAGPTCATGLVACGTTCADLQTDESHCGACDHACTASQHCSSGECKDFCQLDGGTVDEGELDPTNACQTCDPTKARDAWTSLDDGTACGTGKICTSGTCEAKCFIDGALYDDGTANPSNTCETCQTSVSTTAWTPRSEYPLLTGGVDVTTQGWTVIQQATASLTYGADYTRLETSTVTGGKSGGQLLLAKSGAIEAGKPFTIRVQMLVESVSGPHDPLDAAVAIMGSLTGNVGSQAERSDMISVEKAQIRWADDSQSAAFAVTDNAYHTYELSVDAANVATVSIDGVAKLTRNNYTTNGTIAVGDQTNDANVDGMMRIKSVTRACP